MLSTENRLKNKKDFKAVFEKGGKIKQGFLFLRFKENSLKNSRFGFIISKSVSKKAVIRNKIKRKLREFMRKKIKEIKKNIDGIFFISHSVGVDKKSFLKIGEDVDLIFKKLKIKIKK